MFRTIIDRLLRREDRSKHRASRALRLDRREAFLRAIEPPAIVQTWIDKVKETLWKEEKRSRGIRTHLVSALQLESLEQRVLLAADLPLGVFTQEEMDAFETAPFDTDFSTKTVGSEDGGHASDVLTFVLDFKETGQGNTTDIFNNVVSTFDVTSYGFAANQLSTVANAVLAEVDEDYFTELIGTVAGPTGQDLEVDFIIGDIGTAPPGVSEYYYVQIGTGVSGPHSGGTLGVAGGSVVRNSSGTGPNFGIQTGDIVSSVFTDAIVTLSSLSPSDALTTGNLGFTTNAIAGTTSHEIGHTLSLSHVNKAGSTQPTGLPPIMGTGAIDLPNQDRIGDREFSLSGIDGQSGNAARQHIQQLVDAVGLHNSGNRLGASINGNNDLVIDESGNDTDDDLTLSFDGTDYTIVLVGGTLGDGGIASATGDGTNTLTIPAASITGGDIIINSAGGSDTLTLDFSSGDFSDRIRFNGGESADDNDELTLTDTGSFALATYNFNNVAGGDLDNGTIDITGNATITYTGLEPINAGGITATNVLLQYSTTGETITVTDPGGGDTTVSSTSGETVTFANPTGNLTINGGDTGNDTITITSLAASYPANITIDGEGGNDTINVNGALSLGGGLSLTAETIAQTAAITAPALTTLDAGTTGTITLTNTGNDFSFFGDAVTVTADSFSIDDTDVIAFGVVNVTSNVDIDAGGTVFFNDTTTIGGSLNINTLINGGTGGNVDGNNDNPELNVTGTTTITAGTGDVFLNISTNDFVGAITIVSSDQVDIEDDNSLAISSITADTSVFLDADDAITDASVGEAANVDSPSVALRAGTGIGDESVAADFDVTATTLAAVTESGDIVVNGTSDMTIGTVDGLPGVVITNAAAINSTDDNIAVFTTGTLTISSPVTNNDGGGVFLGTNGAADDDVVINSAVSGTGGDTRIDILSADNVTTNTTATITAEGDGNITVVAGLQFLSYVNSQLPNIADGEASANVSMGDGARFATDDGDINVSATDNVVLSRLDANDDSDGTLGQVIVGADFDGLLGLSDGTGAITDDLTGGGPGFANVLGASAILLAASGVGTGADSLDTEVSQLDVTNTTSGTIEIINEGALELTDLNGDANTRSVDGVGGGGEIVASSPLTISSDAITSGGFYLHRS